jgi:MoxR-like ATPase
MDETRDKILKEAGEDIERIRGEMAKRVIGQRNLIDGLLCGLIAQGHILLEGVPGLAKTLAVKTLSQLIQGDFKRIQFTPDLLPADLMGTMIYRQQTGEFVPRKGPVFSNLILADEINRAPAKVQSALLEAMGEKQVTIGEHTFPLPDPFFVLATQNPIEQEGTYVLPEAQLDRFMMKVILDYPEPEEEIQILQQVASGNYKEPKLNPVLGEKSLQSIRGAAHSIRVDVRIETYIVAIVNATREKDKKNYGFARFIDFGASPRAAIDLYRVSRVKAMMEGRAFVLPEDVKAAAFPVLRHRLVLSYEAEAEEMTADDVIRTVLSAVSIPT